MLCLNIEPGTFLVVQWLRLRVPTVGGMGLIPGQGTKILHAVQHGQKTYNKKTMLGQILNSPIFCMSE